MSTETGRVVSVNIETAGDVLAADAPAGSTVLQVDNAVDFSEDGGTLLLNELVLAYASADLDADTVTLAEPLPSDAFEGDGVELFDPLTGVPVQELIAFVTVEGTDNADDALEAVVDHALTALLPTGMREDAGEAVLLERRGGRLFVKDILGQQPRIDGSMIDPETLPGNTPTEAPETSPELVATGMPTSIVLRAQNVDSTTEIEYHVSPVAGFVPDASTLSITTRATVYVMTSLPDSSELELGTTYYFRAVARNVVGSAEPSAEVEAMLNTGAIAEMVAAELVAGFVLAGRIQVGNITIDPNEGIIIPQIDGENTVLRADGQGNTFSGQGTFDALDVLGNLNIRGLRNFVNGLVTLSSGVGDPGQMPTVTASYDTWSTAGGYTPTDTGGFLRRGITMHHANQDVFVTTDTVNGSSNVQGWGRGGGTAFWDFPVLTGWQALGGVTQLGGYYYVLVRQNSNTKNWRILVYRGSDMAYIYSYSTSPAAGNAGTIAPTAYPLIGNDGTNLVLAWPQGGIVYMRRIQPETGAVPGQQIGNTLAGPAWGSTTNVTGIAYWNGRYYIGYSNFLYSYSIGGTATVANSTLVRDGTTEFPLAATALAGLTFDTKRNGLVSFHAGKTFYGYTQNSGTWDFAFTWADNNAAGEGKAETMISPIRRMTPTKYAKWTIALPTTPPGDGTVDGANTANLYAGYSGGVLYRQAELQPGKTRETFDALSTAGISAPSVSGFMQRAATALGRIDSAGTDTSGNALISLRGDGSGRVGPHEWDATGRTLSEPSALYTIPQRQGAADSNFPQAETRVRWTGVNRADPTGTIVQPNNATAGDGRIMVNKPGLYHVDAIITLGSNTTGNNRSLAVKLNDSGIVGYGTAAQKGGGGSDMRVSFYVQLNAGDFLTSTVTHNATAATLGIYGSSAGICHFHIRRVGAL